jgi:hypothetical protein
MAHDWSNMTEEKDKPQPTEQAKDDKPKPAPVQLGEKKTFKQRGVEKRG